MSDEITYAEAMKAIEEVAKFHMKQGHGKYSREIFKALGAIREEVGKRAELIAWCKENAEKVTRVGEGDVMMVPLDELLAEFADEEESKKAS